MPGTVRVGPRPVGVPKRATTVLLSSIVPAYGPDVASVRPATTIRSLPYVAMRLSAKESERVYATLPAGGDPGKLRRPASGAPDLR